MSCFSWLEIALIAAGAVFVGLPLLFAYVVIAAVAASITRDRLWLRRLNQATESGDKDLLWLRWLEKDRPDLYASARRIARSDDPKKIFKAVEQMLA
jgi:hypothetical protein